MPRVDYDLIAHLYDEPMREHRVDERLLAFMDERPELDLATVRVLDVGCGTGRQLAANRTRLRRRTWSALIVSPGCCGSRRGGRPGSRGSRAMAATCRSPRHSFDYATNQFSYQHIDEQESFFHEMHRVLRPGGRFVLTNIDPWSMVDWAIYQFFPETLDLDGDDFLPADVIAGYLREAGFESVTIERRTVRRDVPLADFLAYASERHRASQFMAISDEAYEAGLGRIRAALDEAGAAPVTVDAA